MSDREQIEKVRQEIMRFQELLHLMRMTLETGEREYARLFAAFSPEEKAATKEKDLQWKLAETLVEDSRPLLEAVGRTRFDAREIERAFAELYDIIASNPDGA